MLTKLRATEGLLSLHALLRRRKEAVEHSKVIFSVAVVS